jgi:mannose-1-phosphate guanylyltransferase
MINIILCGGNGTRLWPISRTLLPKQFVRLFDNKSLFQLTIQRNSLFCKKQLIVSNIEQYFLAVAQLEELGEENNSYLLEPIGRNTAPAIALACLSLPQDEIVFVTPSDHLIKNEVAYSKVVNKAKKLAKEGFLVTFGIAPTFAETGFGYIESENEYDVKAFHEKPDELRAKKYLKAGNYFWNSGMFMFQAGVFLKELQKHSPQIFEASKYAFSNVQKGDETIKIKQEDMLNIPEDSIDYAVMEKSDRVKVIPSDIDWSDVGSFDSLYDELPKDENGNTLNEQFLGINSKNNLIYGQQRKIATVDIKDLIVVDTGDALLISKRGSSQKVKKVVQEIRKNSDLHNIHLTVHRPWGTYTILEDTTNYKIKKIVVKAKKRLSLQKHFHRNEHWIVVSGTAVVRVGDEEKILRANESTYIHAGVLHRLENQGNIDLVLIEVQVGEYLGEDDIVRIEDDYERNNI